MTRDLEFNSTKRIAEVQPICSKMDTHWTDYKAMPKQIKHENAVQIQIQCK